LIVKETTALSKAEVTTLEQLEAEADNYAFECLINDIIKDEIKIIRVMAASIAHLSNLYLIKSPYGLIQLGHPDLDTRIFNLMNKVTSNSTEYQDTIDVIYNIFISMFLKKFGIEYETNDVKINGFSSFYQIFDYLYKCIDSEKKRQQAQ